MTEETEPKPQLVAPLVDEEVTLVVAYTEPAAVQVLRASLLTASHLRPLWERLQVGNTLDGRTFVGVCVGSKVTGDTLDNHSRHLFSLFNMLGVPLISSPMMIERADTLKSTLVLLSSLPLPPGADGADD